jgi:hypothetical protein
MPFNSDLEFVSKKGCIKFHKGPPSPQPRAFHSVAVDRQYMIVSGGFSESGDVLNEAHIYDMGRNVWSTFELSNVTPQQVMQHASVMVSLVSIILLSR